MTDARLADCNYVANPSERPPWWIVWNMYEFPPQPIAFGTMEECGMLSDALNEARDG